VHFFDEFRRQLSYAPDCSKDPAFTATALLTLAVCFGANLTIFAVIDFGAAPPPALSRARPAHDDIQYLSEAGVDRDGPR